MFPVMPSALPGGGTFPVEIVLLSTEEPERMLEFAKQIQAKAMQSGAFFFPPIIDTKIDQPQAEVVLDHDKVASLGLNLQDVGSDLSAMFGGNFVNRFNIAGRAYKVIPQIKRAERLNPDQIRDVYVTGPGGKLIPLSTVATIREKTVPRSLNRLQQLNAVTISGASRLPLDQALKLLEAEAARILPKGYTVDYTGESRQLRVEGDKFLPAFALAVTLIFLVLAAQFNSFRDPFIILLGSVPLALFGAMIFMFEKSPSPNLKFFTNAWTTSFNIYSQVGLVTLVGLISKNGILIVQFANKLQQDGLTKIAAVAEASRVRLRPILMTTIATVAGHMPLVFVTGAGAKARNSIGLVLVGGMTIGTIFTLFIVPSLYVLIAKTHNEGREAENESLDSNGRAESDLPSELPEPALAHDGNGRWSPA
jgi:multidrug efflux pump